MPINEGLLPEFEQEMATTRKLLERVPDDKFSWKPHEKSFDMGALASHIASMVGWGATTLKEDSFDVAPPGGEPAFEPPAANRAELLAMFEKNVESTRAALSAASDEAMMKPWSLLKSGAPMFTFPRVAVFRGMIMNHLIHHRGQLSVYLRMNDVPVPSIYGPSADEQPDFGNPS